MGRGDLTAAQWARLAPLLPVGIRSGRPPLHANGSSSTGSGGAPGPGCRGATCPERYGPWETVYGLFRRWQRDGTWRRILTQLQARADAEGLITWDVSVDSTVNRAHQHAAGARKKGLSSANRPAGSTTSPTTTASAAPAAD